MSRSVAQCFIHWSDFWNMYTCSRLICFLINLFTLGPSILARQTWSILFSNESSSTSKLSFNLSPLSLTNDMSICHIKKFWLKHGRRYILMLTDIESMTHFIIGTVVFLILYNVILVTRLFPFLLIVTSTSRTVGWSFSNSGMILKKSLRFTIHGQINTMSISASFV